MRNIIKTKSVQYAQILQDFTEWLQTAGGEITSLNKSTIFGQILIAIASAMHNIMLYIEDTLVEFNKYSCQRRKSIYGLAALSGYIPSTGRAASALIQINPLPASRSPIDIILKNHTQISSTSGQLYNIILPTPTQTISCTTPTSTDGYWCVEGEFHTTSYASPGGAFASINIHHTGYIDLDYITVEVNGEEWEERSGLLDMERESKTYFIRPNPLSGVDVIFGNGIHGKEVSEASIIKVTYLTHNGESGNITTTTDLKFLFIESLQDINGDEVDGNSIFQLTLKSEGSVAAGSDPEDITQTKHLIGYNSRALILATPEAYKAYLSRFSFVGYVYSWIDPSTYIIHSLIIKNYAAEMSSGIDYFATTKGELSTQHFMLSSVQKESIYNAIENSGMSLIGTTYTIDDPEIMRYAIIVYIKTDKTTTSNDFNAIRQQIKTLIGDYFGHLSVHTFIPRSDIIHMIKDNVNGISAVDCYFQSEANDTARLNKKYTTSNGIEVAITTQDPNIGLDQHNNISLSKYSQYPVLDSGWSWGNDANNTTYVSDPVTIIFED